MKTTVDESTTWGKATEGLHIISEKFVPLHTREPGFRTRGDDRYWQIQLADGRIGWGESLAANSHRTSNFYVPQDVADEPWLKAAASAGYNVAWATSDDAAYHPTLSTIIRRASVERQQQLDLDAVPVGGARHP